jgi:hypothetical protein
MFLTDYMDFHRNVPLRETPGRATFPLYRARQLMTSF